MKTKRTSSADALMIINQNIVSDLQNIFSSFNDIAVSVRNDLEGTSKKLLASLSEARVASFDSSQVREKLSRLMSTFKSKDRGYKIKKIIPLIIIVVVVAVILFQVKNLLQGAFAKPNSADNRVTISGPVATQQINKQLDIPIKDNSGKVVTSIKYSLESAELRNEIIVKGERMVAVKGRTFLILNIKLTNNYNQEIDVNARDDIRVTIPGSTDKLAADIHNDPVAIQPKSTKVTRLGFPINDTNRNLALELGTLDGPKQKINLNLK